MLYHGATRQGHQLYPPLNFPRNPLKGSLHIEGGGKSWLHAVGPCQCVFLDILPFVFFIVFSQTAIDLL